MNLVLYVDESGTHDPTGQHNQSQIATVAGYIAKRESWVKFQKDWKLFLAKHRVQYFHYTCIKDALWKWKQGTPLSTASNNPHAGWDYEQCKIFLIEAATIVASGARIPVCGDMDALGIFTARKTENIPGPDNPKEAAIPRFYSAALGTIQSKWPNFVGKLAFYFDQSDPQWCAAIHNVHNQWKKSDARIGTIAFGDKRTPENYGLQAADLVAGRLRQLTRMEKGYEPRLSGPLEDLDRTLFQKFGAKTYEELLKFRTSC